MPHIVIADALSNFEEIKKEIIDGARDSHRAQRGGVNGHSVKWFRDSEIPLTSQAIKKLTFQSLHVFCELPPEHSDIEFEYQFIEYNQPNDQYNWHVDGVISEGATNSRRMTIALNLSTQNEDFIGEGFQLSMVKGFLDNFNINRVQAANFSSALSPEESKILAQKNSVVIFNPDTIHRGSPITSGIRHLLTVWAKW
jgi:predicted 2-oxoglutarate/Fe(II)-dependent dioxygenase YbiX